MFGYDALLNRIKEAWTDAGSATGYGYLPGNHLVQRGNTSYSWSAYGQLMVKDDQPTVSGGETNYGYSARRLLTQVRVNDSPAAQFVYDPYGRRVKAVGGDTTTLTLYSGNDIVYEVRTQAGQALVTTKYLAKVVQEGTNPPQTYFYHVDLVGSVRAITDSQGQVVGRFEYEPFGVTTSASGPLGGSTEAGSETHKFTGKPEDVAIGLCYFNARYYDPRLGRFISSDPVRDGQNWYAYCHSSPLRYTDPTGMLGKGDHCRMTYEEALRVGFPEPQAAMIAAGVEAPDSFFAENAVQEYFGIDAGLSEHFNSVSNRNALMQHADRLFEQAKAADSEIRSLFLAGIALHCVQDEAFHMNWYPRAKVGFAALHPKWYDDPNMDPDWSGPKDEFGAPLCGKPGTSRWQEACDRTEALLALYYEYWERTWGSTGK